MHEEEREFSIVLHVRAEFDEAYTGDEDGFTWFDRFESVLKPRLLSAVYEALHADPGFQVSPAPRGRDPERALELDVVYRPKTSDAS